MWPGFVHARDELFCAIERAPMDKEHDGVLKSLWWPRGALCGLYEAFDSHRGIFVLQSLHGHDVVGVMGSSVCKLLRQCIDVSVLLECLGEFGRHAPLSGGKCLTGELGGQFGIAGFEGSHGGVGQDLRVVRREMHP